MRNKPARFANAAIDALGGTCAVADVFGVDARVVSNWRIRGLPAARYAVLAPMLINLGWEAPPAMFGQRVRPFPVPENGKAQPSRRP